MARMPRPRVLVPVIIVCLLGLVGVFALVGALTASRTGGFHAQKSSERAAASAYGAAAQALAPSGVNDATSAGASGGASGSGVALDVPPTASYSAHRLVRTGDLSLLVARGALLSTVDRITSMTEAAGGYVMSSAIGSDSGTPVPLTSQGDQTTGGATAPADVLPAQTTATPGTSAYATLTLRVPESSFDATVKRFAGLGQVQSVTTSSQDVTSQYVDLQARLRHYRAVEDRLVRFLAATHTINQMLAVQDRIDKVQLTIEELSAQLKSLTETTTYGTLSVYLREKGAAHVAVGPAATFGGTLWHSLKVLGHGARVTALALTAMLPFVVLFGGIALIVWYVVRRMRRGRRQTAQPSLPA